MKPLLLSILGKKGSGRSEALTSLISILRKSGLRVGVIKHLARDDFEIDEPSKDTFQYRIQGAEKVILSGRRRLAVFANLEEETPLRDLVSQFQGYDLVFLEGYFLEELPKIEIHKVGTGSVLAKGLQNVLAICSDQSDFPHGQNGIPYFSLTQLPELANLIENQLLMSQWEGSHVR